jgi:hypothetical protein
MKRSSLVDKEIQGIIRTLAVHCAQRLDCSKDDRKTPVETACNEMVIGAVWAFCEFSLLVSLQNHSDLSLTALDDTLKQLYKKQDAF